ncbi:MAG: hypothetical protein DBY05_11120 [Clostridiales bacterium]|nr:MAG: hypothetical protein DBY05_11120 [Clostridiales bacterium]
MYFSPCRFSFLLFSARKIIPHGRAFFLFDFLYIERFLSKPLFSSPIKALRKGFASGSFDR